MSTPEHGYWRSLDELARGPDYLEQSADEFGTHGSTSPADDTDHPSGLSRRRFLALVAASAALGVAGCGKLNDRGEVVAYADQPEGTPPGTPRHYASCLPSYLGAPAVLVTTREGRPVKVEGNPDHPASGGALDAFAQSATLSLYDPDRLRNPLHAGRETSWEKADATVKKALSDATASGKGILLITPPLVSPTMRALVMDFAKAHPGTKHLSVDTIDRSAAATARKSAWGTDAIPAIDWAVADCVLSLDADFLGPGGQLVYQRGFITRREAGTGMNRLWVVEGGLTSTGCSADHRLRLRPTHIHRLLQGLLHEIVVVRGIGPLAGDTRITSLLTTSLDSVTKGLGLDAKWTATLANDLVAHAGRSVVLAGDHLPGAVQTLTHALNATLDAAKVLDWSKGTRTPNVSDADDVTEAVRDLNSGRIGVVLDFGANSAYALPPRTGFVDALKKVPLVVSASLVADETAIVASWAMPLAHDLESWGDCDLHVGMLTLQQPVIKPLFGGRQSADMLLAWMPKPPAPDYRTYIANRWEKDVYASSVVAAPFERFWQTALHDGVLPVRSKVVKPRFRLDTLPEALTDPPAVSGLDIILAPSPSVWDGRFTNSGWLQEKPHPVTSQVWGNAAVMSRTRASELGVSDGDPVTLSVGGESVILPTIIGPGVAENVVIADLGYGRSAGGRVGSGVGVDVRSLMGASGSVTPRLLVGASLAKVVGDLPEGARLVRTQEHHNILGRHIVAEGTEAGFTADSSFVSKIMGDGKPTASQGGWQYTGHKWGMAIDLSSCIGCGACQVACTAENNVPVVGPEQVAKGREMHWIRIDRYYSGDPDDPKTVHQPMLCQHCDNAPCENVCPVAATAHSPEGLNEMAYNRCVGTRYCGNNCPYKVRRFNFFDWFDVKRTGGLTSPRELMFNPEVTVRSRGVMEKCSFCTQRIAEGKHAATREGRTLNDGDIQTACQQTCPTGAIVFGDLNDTESRIHKLAKSKLGFKVISEVGTSPVITYLAKMRNPHPDLDDHGTA
jgi:MoCo/4Fe-4S cofactor protein with predicted Tat translocation signal